MMHEEKQLKYSVWEFAGLILTPLRISVGWIIFSAMWRRFVLKPESLDTLSQIYDGLKFNHFIASAIGIVPFIKFLIGHPEILYFFLWIFTVIEGLIGLGLIFGLLTRLASLGSFLVILGIMLGAGWLGTTCVDEWQIGIFGLSSSFALFFSGGGPLSLDHVVFRNRHRYLAMFASAPFYTAKENRKTFNTIVTVSLLLFGFALLTNQANVGGVWGPFKNPAIKPYIVLSDATLDSQGNLKFTLFRSKGPDTYGAFITQLKVLDSKGNAVYQLNGEELGSLHQDQIQNKYLVQVKPNVQSLLVPLAGKAEISLNAPLLQNIPNDAYTLEIVDISNAHWETSIE